MALLYGIHYTRRPTSEDRAAKAANGAIMSPNSYKRE
jgi:hypothetical protein